MPSPPASFPEMSRLSEAELSHLQANPLSLDDWLTTSQQVQDCSERARKLREEHATLANNVLAKESQFNSLSLNYERSAQEVSQRQAAVQTLLASRDEVLRQQSPAQLQALLQAKAQASDNDAENCLQQALIQPGTLDGTGIAEFRERYRKLKAEKHARLALRESLVAG